MSDKMLSVRRSTFPERLCHRMPLILAGRLSKVFLARESQSPRTSFEAKTLTGRWYANRTGDYTADYVRMCGYYDWRMLAIAKAVCSEGGHIIEIGANTGTETLGLADIVGPAGRVTAFEPSPENLAILSANVVRNNLRHVGIVPSAVGDSIGEVGFLSFPSCNSGMGHIDVGASGTDVAKVAVVTLDSEALRLGSAELITIDVEGYEMAVLRGATKYLRKYRPVLYVEANAVALSRTGSTVEDLAAQLRDRGYVLYEITRLSTKPLKPVPLDRQSNYFMNWLALPSERPELRMRVNWLLWVCAFLPRIANMHPLLGRART